MQIPNEKRIAIEQKLMEGRNLIGVTAAAACLSSLVGGDEILASVVVRVGEESLRVLLVTATSLVAGDLPSDERSQFSGQLQEFGDLSVAILPLASLRRIELVRAYVWTADQTSLDVSPRYRLHFDGVEPIDLPWGDARTSMDAEVDTVMTAIRARWPTSLP